MAKPPSLTPWTVAAEGVFENFKIIFTMTSERKYEGKGTYATSTHTNGSNPEQTATSANTILTVPTADQLLADQLANPITTTSIRTNLRSWFLSAYAVEGSAFDWSGPISVQKRNYEVLDELLATCTREALGATTDDANVAECLEDHFSNPLVVLNIRRTLRRWFLAGQETEEQNIGTIHETQVEHYELLDELLSSLVEKLITQSE